MKTRLNLGCGMDYREGWVNLDANTNVKADIHSDLNKRLPFEDNSFDVVLAKKCLEDTDDPNSVIEEIWRVLKPEGLFEVHCSFGGSLFDYHSIFHKSHFIPKTFDIYVEGTSLNRRELLNVGLKTKARFKKKTVKVRPILLHVWLPGFFQYISIFLNILGGFKAEYIAKK